MGGVAGTDPLAKGSTGNGGGGCRAAELAARAFAMLLSIAGAAAMGNNKQDNSARLGSVVIGLSARHSYIEAFVYLVYANGIAAVYCFLSILVVFFCEKQRLINTLLFILDQAMAFLLLAAAACSTEASYIAKRGEVKVGWSEVCTSIERFCNVVGISLVLTFMSVLVFIALGVISSKRLFGHSALCAPSSNLPDRV
ncbi:hypothetical protein KP509_23G007600 [Ceratopteris richardii]|uniref:CASP-like protein n=1 Tax=Ceratopteris richardii TaxID=49495 RepID=A0A8T2RZU9_CERRI|nr:hypothetical protein KP509_23G007600 [Ceratopteris richardii]